MKRIVCEMCDGWDFIKQDGLLVCQGCGCKYPVAEAKKLMVDIPDEPAAPVAPAEPAPVAATPTPTSVAAPTAPEPAPVAADPIPTGENCLAVRVLSLGHRQGEGQFLPGPDLAGNIGARILLENQGPKTLRYAGVYLRPLTAQGGETGCMVKNHTVMGIRIAEPVEPETQWEGICTGMWCNRFITAARIDRVEVLYTDGTTQTFQPDDLSPFQA